MKRIILLLGIFILGVVLVGCAPKVTPAEKPVSLETKSFEVQATVKEPWQVEWEKTLREAQKEGRVVVYGGGTAGALREHATKIVKEKLGFDLEAVSARGADIQARISSERRAGLYTSDIYASGQGEMYTTFKPLGWSDPLESLLILPEVLDPKAWYGGKLPWGDKERKVFSWPLFADQELGINTNLVKVDEITSFQDLLLPRWKDKIVVNDPTTSGKGETGFIVMLYNKMVDVDFFKELVRKQSLVVTRDHHFQIGGLAKGKFSIALWPSTTRIAEYMAAGAPVTRIVTKEGINLAAGGGGLALMNKAPHPNAAKIFINWFLSKEGQYLLQAFTGKHSARVDIPADNVEPMYVRKPGVKYLISPTSIEEFVLTEESRYKELAVQIFGPLVGR